MARIGTWSPPRGTGGRSPRGTRLGLGLGLGVGVGLVLGLGLRLGLVLTLTLTPNPNPNPNPNQGAHWPGWHCADCGGGPSGIGEGGYTLAMGRSNPYSWISVKVRVRIWVGLD